MTPGRAGDVATHSSADQTAALRVENDELRRRVEAAERMIDELRAEALERRREVRRLAEALPLAMSRRAVVRAMLRDVRGHPDKAGVARRGVRKLARAPRKGLRAARAVLRAASSSLPGSGRS